MIYIELKRKPIEILTRGLCIFLAFFALFLIILSMIFSFGGDAPSIFGKNVYIVKTDAFDIIKKGDAVLTSEVPPEEITNGNIIIFQNSEKKRGIAEIHNVTELDGVFTFSAKSEQGNTLTISQGQIIGKAMQFSGFLGTLITFAVSPSGVLVIAVIPCISILLYEFVKFLLSFLNKEQDIEPVKKQNEVPTFIPRQKLNKAVSAYSKTNETISVDSKRENKNNKSEFDLGEHLSINGSVKPIDKDSDDYPLFIAPKANVRGPRSTTVPLTPEEIRNQRARPLSQKRLNDVIAQTKTGNLPSSAANESEPFSPPIAGNDITNTAEIKDISKTPLNNKSTSTEIVRRYTPKKGSSSTATIPRLDQLLRDDSDAENIRYDIGDILSSLEKK